MVDKVPCKECSELILPVTAEKTGGICMACKQGIRQDIGQAKEFCRKLGEYDPYRELWLHLVRRAYAAENGSSALTEEERLYFAVVLFDGEVYNGGMEQFFSNSSGEYFSEVVDGLETLKAAKSLSLLKQATKILFGDIIPPKDRLLRFEAMRKFPDDGTGQRADWEIELDEIDRQYWEDPDNLSEILSDYAEKTGLIEPFKINPNPDPIAPPS